MRGVFRLLGHARDVVDVNRHVVEAAHHQLCDIFRGAQEGSCHHGEVGVAGLHSACPLLGIGCLDGLRNLVEADVVTRKPLRVDLHTDLFGATAHDEAFTGIRQLVEALQHIVGEHPQLAVIDVRPAVFVEILGPERDGDDGYVVDPLGLHQRR